MAYTLVRDSLTFGIMLAICVGAVASEPSEVEPSAEEIAYREAILQRSTRIVDQLQLRDEKKLARVTELVANQYRGLRDLHATRDKDLAALRENHSETPHKRQKVAADVASATLELHRKFVAQLSVELSLDQVAQVKDGMTYGVATNTYNAYLELLPELPDDLKRMIKANLLEAREYAMDAGSSDRKHAWFGKYKGRINNELSAAGYDLKQAERDLALRRDASEKADSKEE